MTPTADPLRRLVRKAGLGPLALRWLFEPVQRLARLRLPNRGCVVDVQGFRLEVLSPRRNRIGEALYRDAVWEPRVTATVREIVRPGMIVLDVGADIGYYAVLFASLTESGRVIAFEPIPEARSILDRNVRRNGLGNVSICPYALGAREGRAWLREPFELSRIDLHDGDRGRRDIEVSIRRFDDLARELGVGRVDLVKIDVEGAEHEVLRGLEGTVARDRPACLVEVHGTMLPLFGSDKGSFIEWMEDRGYRWRWVDGVSAEDHGTSTLLFEQAAA